MNKKTATAAAPPPPVPTEQRMVMYRARDGQEIQLNIAIVRDFLVTGKKELVTVQEFMYFMGICRARGLNPFARDCYLIKYSEGDSAAIVTSIDFYRSRARAQKDCKGWEKGVIVQKASGELRYSKGLVLEGEKLVGGWFRAQPEGWEIPFELELNLEGYIKRTRTGDITKFWTPANQPTMIAKCAESQGLRTLWPDEFRGTITAEEAGLALETVETIDLETVSAMAGETKEEVDTSVFDLAVKEQLTKASASEIVDTMDLLEKFLDDCADANSRGGRTVTAADVKVEAGNKFPVFWGAFQNWISKRKAAQEAVQEKPPVEGVKEPEVVEGKGSAGDTDPFSEEAPAPAQPDLAQVRKEITEIQTLAIKKHVDGEVMKQFKVNSWDDFLALDPDMIPTLRKFVEEAPQK